MIYFLYFILAAILSLLITPLIKLVAVKTLTLDYPKTGRKIHTVPMPLLGGLAIFLGFLTSLVVYLWLGHPDFLVVPKKFFEGIIIGAVILMLGGVLDDKYDLSPKLSILFPALASLAIVWSGIGVGITYLSNPFGQPVFIGFHYSLSTIHYSLPALLAWLWMMGMIYTTKLLDGLDGLCSGIGIVGALTMFALSLTNRINQPITATLAIILAGSILGFLFYNFNPAKIFLGEAGSTFIGFILGVLAIILGAKIATALLIMGIPILDVAWAIVRRIFYHRSPFSGDRSHLHYRLLDIGLSQRQAVAVLWLISAIFGFTAVFLQSKGKLIALAILFAVMLILAVSVVIIYKRQHPHIQDLFDNTKK